MNNKTLVRDIKLYDMGLLKKTPIILNKLKPLNDLTMNTDGGWLYLSRQGRIIVEINPNQSMVCVCEYIIEDLLEYITVNYSVMGLNSENLDEEAKDIILNYLKYRYRNIIDTNYQLYTIIR